MNVSTALRQGIHTLRHHKKMVFFFLLWNQLAALLLVFPLYFLLDNQLKTSLYGRHLAQRFEASWILEFLHQFPSLPVTLGISIAGIGFFYLLWSTYLSAGALAIFQEGEGFSLRRFSQGAGTYFSRFFRLLLFSIAVYGLGLFVYTLLSNPLNKLVADTLIERNQALITWTRLGLFFLIFATLNLWLEYTKIKLVVDQRTSAFLGLFRSLPFLIRNFRGVLGLYLSILSLGFTLTVGYHVLSGFFQGSSSLALLGLFLLQQLTMLFRMAVRLLFYSAQLPFYIGMTQENKRSLLRPFSIPTNGAPISKELLHKLTDLTAKPKLSPPNEAQIPTLQQTLVQPNLQSAPIPSIALAAQSAPKNSPKPTLVSSETTNKTSSAAIPPSEEEETEKPK